MAQCIVKGCLLDSAVGGLCPSCHEYLSMGLGNESQAYRNSNQVVAVIRESAHTIAVQLKAIDVTLASLVHLSTEESLPSAGELFEKVSGLGARAVLNVIRDWEKRNGSDG